MKKVYILWPFMQMGGTETLIVRIYSWLVKQNYEVIVVSKVIYDSFKSVLKKNNVKIQLSDFRYWGIQSIIKDADAVIVFRLDDYFLTCDRCKTVLYNVHELTLIRGQNINKYIGHLVKKIYRILIKQLDINNSLIFMDNHILEVTEKYYKMKMCPNVIKLPMMINKEFSSKKRIDKVRNILTIARSEFPFKGYLLGLINYFNDIGFENKNINLTIITSGEDSERLFKLKNGNPRITILKDVMYNDLNKYFDNTDFYIGVGSSLLDASNRGVPSLVVGSYTYECVSIGLFCDNINNLGYLNDDFKPISIYMDNLKRLDAENYYKLSIKTFELYKKNYDIDINLPKILLQLNSVTICNKKLLILLDRIVYNTVKLKARMNNDNKI
ncbi:MAG: hypothetical protein RSC93_08390 [Erysipelotrichaceae bacterium]